jgi:hypothetical protein
MSLGGTEIANSSRFLTYVGELIPGLQVEDCYDCADLGEILGDGPYNSPLVDQPDWYAVNQPDSAEFCGFYPLEVEGIDDGTRTATVTELALDGAMVGAPRYASREIRVSGLLAGATDAAVQYGLRWLAKALEGAACRDATGCTGDHLCYYAACPPMCTDSPALDGWDPEDPDSTPLPFYLCDDGMITTAARACSVEYERTLYQVTMTSGPTVVEQYNSTCGALLRVEFTLVAGVPFAFSTAISAAPGTIDIPDPVTVPEISCTPGTDVVVRTNLATNPVPSGNAAVAGGGWQADGTGFTVTPDPDVAYDPTGGASVRIARTAVTPLPNLATNPDPADDLDGWAWQLGQGSPSPGGPRTNLHINPRLQGAPIGPSGLTSADVGTGAPDGRSWRRGTFNADVGPSTHHIGYSTTYNVDIDPTNPPAISAYALRSVAGPAQLIVRRFDASGTQVAADVVSDTFNLEADTWTRLNIALGPQPALVAAVLVRVAFTGAKAAGDIIGASEVLIEDVPEVGPYFDGGTPDGAGYDYAWTGAENASTSTATGVSPDVTTELVDDGDGPDQDTYMRTTIVNEKVGGQDGVVYAQAAGPGVYTLDMSVRVSNAMSVQLVVTATDAAGIALASSMGMLLVVPVDTWASLGPVRIIAPEGTTTLRVAALMPGSVVLPGGETFDAAAVRVYSGTAVSGALIGTVTFVGQHDDDVATISVSPGSTVTASVYVGSSVAAYASTTVRFYDASGAVVLTRTGPRVDLPRVSASAGAAGWRRSASVAAVAPSTATSLVVSTSVSTARPTGAEVGDLAWLTSALIEEADGVMSYFDGSTSDTASMSYVWTGTEHESTSQAVLSLPDSTDGGRIVDPDCAPIPDPPRPPVIDVSCVDTPTTWRRYQVQVADTLVPEWFDAVPVIRLQTGASDVRQVRIRFYPNPLAAPIGALDPCSYCGEFVVTYIPANSLMVIDGIRQWVTVTNTAGVVSTANHLLASSDGGPVSWPLLGCGVGYTLVVDVSPTDVADLEPQICLAARA